MSCYTLSMLRYTRSGEKYGSGSNEIKKREFTKGRACIPVKDFWKQMRKSSKNKNGISLEGTQHEGHGYSHRFSCLGDTIESKICSSVNVA